VQHVQRYFQELDGSIEQEKCDALLHAYKNNPDYNPNAHRFTLPWPNYLSGDAILGPATQKLSPTTNETSLNATIEFSNMDQSSEPPPLLARDDSSDDDSLFGDSDSSVHSAISVKPPPQPYPYMVDPINHEDERYYLLHPSITPLAQYKDDKTTDSQQLETNLYHYYLLMSRFWDTFAAEMLSTIADYPIRQVYVTPDGMDFLPNIKEIQDKLFFEPPRSWGPFWPTSYSEAQSIISPHDLCEELERLTGYTVNEQYYNSVIAKAYESE
jgi:hypothetical protein